MGPTEERAHELLEQTLAEVRDGQRPTWVGPTLDPTTVVGLLRAAADAEATIEWLGVNEHRVDAGLRGAGDEWRLVAITSDDGETLRDVFAYRRPAVFEGVPGGRAIIVNGPSGAGKSTLLEAIARGAGTPWVLFDEPEIGRLADGYRIWRETAPSLRAGWFRAMAGLASAGNQVAAAAGGFGFDDIAPAMGDVPTLFVGLDCPLPLLLERERGREGRWAGLAEASLGVHEGWSYDLRFDTASAPPEAIAVAVLGAVATRWPVGRPAPAAPRRAGSTS